MASRFKTKDVRKLLHNKFVLVLGDSVQRSVYKDLVQLLISNDQLTKNDQKFSGEYSFRGDRLVEGGMMGKLHNGRNLREVREYVEDNVLIRFYYLTICYGDYMETVLHDIETQEMPDVIIMNSCLWDSTRYGPNSFPQYKKNLQMLFYRIRQVISKDTLFIWRTTLPIAKRVTAPFLTEDIKFYERTLRYDVLVANYYAREVAVDYDLDVFDAHYHFRDLLYLRIHDGVHWGPRAHRILSEHLLTHIAEGFGFPLPKFSAFRSERPDYVRHSILERGLKDKCDTRYDRRPQYTQPKSRSHTAMASLGNGSLTTQEPSKGEANFFDALDQQQQENEEKDKRDSNNNVSQPMPAEPVPYFTLSPRSPKRSPAPHMMVQPLAPNFPPAPRVMASPNRSPAPKVVEQPTGSILPPAPRMIVQTNRLPTPNRQPAPRMVAYPTPPYTIAPLMSGPPPMSGPFVRHGLLPLSHIPMPVTQHLAHVRHNDMQWNRVPYEYSIAPYRGPIEYVNQQSRHYLVDRNHRFRGPRPYRPY